MNLASASPNLTDANVARVYRVAGQQALRLCLQRGDLLEIRSPDRCQLCAMLLCDESGSAVAPWFETTPCSLVEMQLLSDGAAARQLRDQLLSWGLAPAVYKDAFRQFELHAAQALKVEQDVVMVLVAAGVDMIVWDQHPAGELEVRHVSTHSDRLSLPAPLAAPLADIRVPHSSAVTYTVEAGQWIQIIDVEGKQCSDFIAFDLAAVESGREVTLDAAATRTLMGHDLPQPGLYSRFYDNELRSMLEVVQDTVGRHDSFLLACTPKYYDDAGYFGHASCSDNFNQALKPHGVSPRAGWPAINFFFNTSVEPCGSVGMDEPWSRAGDYVLLRANRDLLCASSACPDDIDPANGWTPTDIHVRIYDASHEFPRAIAHRLIPEELPRMTKQSGFHRRTSALTTQFSEYRGYWVADAYHGGGAVAEYLACRERVAAIDLSALRKFEVLGPDAETLLQYALTRNVRRVAVGEIVYSAMCHETGGMIDDGTLFRMGDQAFRWICGDPYSGVWLRQLAQSKGWNVQVRESSEQIHNLAVQGPKSRELLASLVWTPEAHTPLAQLAWFHFTLGRLGGADGVPLMISRTGYTGELGFEVWCHPDHAEAVWDAIFEAGEAYGIAPMGFAALDMLRIEAGLIFAGHEFCEETNPFEAGISFTVALKTNAEDFVGRAAIEKQAPESRQRLVGLIMEGNEPAAHGDPVFNGRFKVGVVTSATHSPLTGKQIALCRLAPEFAATDTSLQIGKLDGLQKRLAATVCSLPFYDPERTRVRG